MENGKLLTNLRSAVQYLKAQHFDPVKPPNLVMNFLVNRGCEFAGQRTDIGRTEDNQFSKGLISV